MRLFNNLLKIAGIKLTDTPRFIAKSAKFVDFNLIALGDRVIVSSNVIFLTHDYSFTTGLISINEKPNTDIGILRPISIGDNVFIGMNVIILPGTVVANNVIIGAGSVVRGNVPENSVVSGNPAVIISDLKEYTDKIKAKNYMQRVDQK